ncbi:glycosyltransferase family 4 protein [candidate division KSB1 bacterium]|nr:glycosyltransferase family 4 protein [candidate division KSB1 bacterium]
MKKRPIKILLIQSRICVGGPAIHTELLSLYLPKDKYRIILIGGALQEGELSTMDQIRQKGVDIRIVEEMKRDVNLIGDLKAVYKVYRIIKKEKPDIVDTHTSKAGAIGRIAAVLAGVPVVLYTFHGHAFKKYFSKLKTVFFIFVEKFLAFFTTKIITISPLQYEDLTNKYHIAPKNKFIILRYGIILEMYFELVKSKALKSTLGIPEDHILIGIVGRLVPIKNQSMILRVMKILIDRGLNIHLCIVGDGEEREKLEKLSAGLNVNDRVHFVGWVLDMEKIYAGIDILALTSHNEGTPFTVIEAMAASVPVVATNVGGVADLLLDNRNGLLCKPDDEFDMAEKIIKLLHDNNFTDKLCRNAKTFVKENYTHKHLIRDMDQLYTELFSEIIN